ncbi:MAG: MaoC family dehydratase N-terminal domain-containing protein [Burkholderiaceae bacterium]|nr:MaoC family dehydratase N-terminal domain-containing protein [Burkholderiaceae bacterium]
MNLEDWIGRVEEASDVVAAGPCAALAATLDQAPLRPAPGTLLPPLWHLLYFLPAPRRSELGEDGHALRGGFLPPVDLPRRMWAGSQLEFRSPLRVGDTLLRRSRIESISEKSGRSGKLVFVHVRHDIGRAGDADPALVEHHDIVYREAPRPSASGRSEVATAAPTGATWTRCWQPDEVLLFRYSALTFNGHRIHYDRRYATEVEGYPGLVVHGPLIATLLLELLRERMPGAWVSAYQFKAIRPSFDLHPLHVNGSPEADGKTVRLWAHDHEGWLTMQAQASIEVRGGR